MTDPTIPPEAAKAVRDLFDPGYLESIGLRPESIVAAAINAWPGMTHGWKGDPQHYKGGEARIILPLSQERADD